MKIRHAVIIAIFVTVNVMILYILFGSGGPKMEDKEVKEFVQNLKAIKYEPIEERFEIAGFGNVTSYNSLEVISEVQGEILWGKATLKPGTNFKKGQLLYTINDRELRYSLRARKSSFINLIANALPDIKVDFSSEYGKWEAYLNDIKLNDNLPQLPSWKSDKEKVFLSSRQILTEYFTIKGQEEQLGKYLFYAPFSGMVSEVYVSEHSIANPGTRICKIIENANFEIPVSLPSNQKEKIKVGNKVIISTSNGVQLGEGKISRFADLINQNTQSITVYVSPSKELEKTLTEGEYVKVSMPQTEVFKGIRLPYSSVNDGQVLIYNPSDSTLAKQNVTVLNENSKGIFISGLDPNQIIISQEVITFSDSTKFGIILE